MICVPFLFAYVFVVTFVYPSMPVGTDQERIAEVLKAWATIRVSHQREAQYIDNILASMHMEIRVGDKVTMAQIFAVSSSSVNWIMGAIAWLSPASSLVAIN